MYIDSANKRAQKLIQDYNLSEDELRQIIADARFILATFNPE